jgi:MFS family permease
MGWRRGTQPVWSAALTPSQGHPMTDPDRHRLLINIAHGLTHYCLLILPTAVLAMARPGEPFGESYGPVLALATGMFVLYGVFSLPQGWLADRIGRKALMAAFFLGTGVSLMGCGFANAPLTLALALCGVGLFTAIYHPIGTALLVETAGDQPGRAIGVNGVFGNVGVALAPVVTAFMADQAGWRSAFLLPGFLCLFMGLFWLRMPTVEAQRRIGGRPFPPIPRHLVRRALIVLLSVAAASGLVFNAFTLLLPKLMEERLASDPALLPLIGAAAFAATLCGAVTQFSVGRLIDRHTLKRVLLPVSVVLCPALALLSFVDGWVVVPLAGAVAASLFGQVTVNETMAARYISPELRTRIYSVRFFVGFLGAAAAAPVVGFLHAETGSLTAATAVLAAFSVVTLVCALWFPDRAEELQPERWALAPAE